MKRLPIEDGRFELANSSVRISPKDYGVDTGARLSSRGLISDLVLDLAQLEATWKQQHPKSKILFQEARNIIPGGVHHALMIDGWPIEREVYPFYVTKADGTKIYDADGNAYTDYYAHGATFLGHTHPDVLKAIQEYASLGPFSYDFTEINVKLVKKVVKMIPCAEEVDLVNSGTEAVMGALRYARAYTKRKKIVAFAGHYNGWGDQLSAVRYGIPEEVFANSVVIPEGDVPLLEKTMKGENPAAVIFHFSYGSGGGGMAMGGEHPLEFMRAMREITSRYGALLIADEVVTGFRYAPGGAQQYFNIDVDMATLGKMVGGALGGSGAIVGKKEIMECGNPKARPRGEFVLTGGTFSGNPLNSAAGYAALEVIDRAEGALNRHANSLGERFRKGLNGVFGKYDFPAQAVGCCSTNGVAFTEKLPIKTAAECEERNSKGQLYKWLMYLATNHGIYTFPGGIFITAVHTEADIDRLIAATETFVKKERA